MQPHRGSTDQSIVWFKEACDRNGQRHALQTRDRTELVDASMVQLRDKATAM
jgi:hypothetical protein